MSADMSREWELGGRFHRTEADAFAFVARAKVSAHVAATDTYLVRLRAELYTWIASIDAELAERDAERARREDTEDV